MPDDEPFPLLPISCDATIRKCRELPLRGTDVFVCSYPKSGTTWMQHILHTLATNGESPLPHISDACPFFEVDRTWAAGSDELTEAVQTNHKAINRRIFNTHLLWSMMPKSHPDARYVYMVRQGVDTCASFYHHLSHQAEADGGFLGALPDFVGAWTGGEIAFGSWSAHLKAWLGSDAATDPRVLIVPYEALRADPKTWVAKVNAHCRFGVSDARIDELLPRFSFEWMRANEAVFEPRSVRWVKRAGDDDAAAGDGAAFHFIRAGRVGDGEKAFDSPAERALLLSMVRRSFPTGAIPEYVMERLPMAVRADCARE